MNNALEIIKDLVDQLARENVKVLAPIVLELTAKDWNGMSVGIEYDNYKLHDSFSYIIGNVEVSVSKKKAMATDRIDALKEELKALEGM